MNVLHKHKEAALLLLVGGLNEFTPPFIVLVSTIERISGPNDKQV